MDEREMMSEMRENSRVAAQSATVSHAYNSFHFSFISFSFLISHFADTRHCSLHDIALPSLQCPPGSHFLTVTMFGLDRHLL